MNCLFQVKLVVLIVFFSIPKQLASSHANETKPRDLLIMYGDDLAAKVQIDNCVGCHDFGTPLPHNVEDSFQESSINEDIHFQSFSNASILDNVTENSDWSFNYQLSPSYESSNPMSFPSFSAEEPMIFEKSSISEDSYFQSFSDSSILDNITESSDWSFRKYLSNASFSAQLSQNFPETYKPSYLLSGHEDTEILQQQCRYKIECNQNETEDNTTPLPEQVAERIPLNNDRTTESASLMDKKSTSNNQSETIMQDSFQKQIYSERKEQPRLFDYVAQNDLGKDKIG